MREIKEKREDMGILVPPAEYNGFKRKYGSHR
jgi:hypothetical protein